MSKFPVFLDPNYGDDDRMACPICGDGGGLHIDGVQVAARKEDGPFKNIEVDGLTGYVNTSAAIPVGEVVGEGRRHRIVLIGWCEFCGPERFAIVMTQHKGGTYVEVKRQTWVAR